MEMSLWQQIAELPAVEIIAAVMGVISVWFARSNNILVYPTGIVSVTLYVIICLNVQLYVDAFINFYYLVMSIYGWYFWLHGGKLQHSFDATPNQALDSPVAAESNEEKAHITTNTLAENVLYLIFTGLVYVLLGYILSEYTNSDVAWVDAFTTSMFVTAMYAMAKKKIEHWIFWILGNAVSIPLYLYKELPVTSIQYVVFLVLAIWGFAVWYRKLSEQVAYD